MTGIQNTPRTNSELRQTMNRLVRGTDEIRFEFYKIRITIKTDATGQAAKKNTTYYQL